MAREYKDSGIEWIGQIPKEWRIVPFKAYFTTGKGLSFTKADLTPQGHAVVSYGQVHSKVNTGTRLDDTLLRYIPDSITENGDASRMNKGDFIFADTSEDLEGCGNCVYVDRYIELYAGYHSVTAKPKVQYDNKFFAYYFQTPCWRSQIRSRVTGIKVYSISQSIINKTFIFVPPLSTQQKIADYLDKVCGEVDEMVALQETMIEELKAYKQSVITEAVTKGLNPNVPMRNSGIDWIGKIPEGWKIEPFKVHFKTGKGLSFTKAELVKEGHAVISYGQVHSKKNTGTRIDDELIRFVPDKIIIDGDSSRVCMGDFIFADTSEDLSGCGNCVYVDREMELYAGYHSVVAFSKVKQSNAYLAYLFLTDCWRSQIRGRVSGIKVFSVSQSIINQTSILLPPLPEQQQIASYLDTKCSEIDSLIALKQTKIEELKEYKKSVIYEYVTGKKEVE